MPQVVASLALRCNFLGVPLPSPPGDQDEPHTRPTHPRQPVRPTGPSRGRPPPKSPRGSLDVVCTTQTERGLLSPSRAKFYWPNPTQLTPATKCASLASPPVLLFISLKQTSSCHYCHIFVLRGDVMGQQIPNSKYRSPTKIL